MYYAIFFVITFLTKENPNHNVALLAVENLAETLRQVAQNTALLQVTT
jgi:hypothetical protein